MIVDKLNRRIYDLRLSVIDACNFRCKYCMPVYNGTDPYTFLNKNDRLTADEYVRLARIFVSLGVSKIKITGGEPLLRKDLVEIIESISNIPQLDDIALTTNGYWLARCAKPLFNAGLNRINVSLDALNDDTFSVLNGVGVGSERILQGIFAAQEAGFNPIKVNVLVYKGINDDAVLEMAEFFRGTGIILRFIEYMDVGNRNGWQSSRVTPSSEILNIIGEVYPLIPIDQNYYGEVANRYRYVDGKGEIGFISSVTQTFCGSCNRIRVSSDGKMYTCLFASKSTDLRSLLRDSKSDQDIADHITAIWQGRTDRYSEERISQKGTTTKEEKVEMYQIGG